VSEQKKAAPAATTISGSEFAGSLGEHEPGTIRPYKFWVGVFPSCPVEGIYCAGISFPKVTERLIRGSKARTGTTERIPRIGTIVALTADKAQLLRERLPRLVLRFNEPRRAIEHMAGSTLGDATREDTADNMKARRGRPIRIPSPKDLKNAEASGRGIQRYVRQDNDEPAARYMFAVLCEDQDNPEPGSVYPDSLEETGLTWPERLE
jgi:hypothetical protein